MAPRDKASKLREVFVASDPTNHGGWLVVSTHLSFLSAVQMESATYRPVPILTTFLAHLSLHAPL